MNIIEKTEIAMAVRRAELIDQPLHRIWRELAETAYTVYQEEHRIEQMQDWGLIE